MAKPIVAVVKLQVPAGQATPAPPVGTALGPHGVNIMEFVKQFNARTQSAAGMVTPVEVTIFKDRTFTFITKTPPAAVLLKKEAGIEKGSPTSNRQKVGTVTDYYAKISVAAIKLVDGALQVGDTIHIRGHTTDLTQTVESLQTEHRPVQRAERGSEVAVKVSERVRKHDEVHRVSA